MSRQGNYVTVPNVGGNNALSGLSDSLANLATLMHNRNISEQAQEQWEAEEAQAKLEADRQYRHQRDVLSSDNTNKRLDREATQKRHKDNHALNVAEDKREQGEYDLTVSRHKALGEINQLITNGYAQKHKFKLQGLPEYLQGELSSNINRLETGRDQFLSFANGDLSDTAIAAAVDKYNTTFKPRGRATAEDVEAGDRRLGAYKAFAAKLKAAKTPEERQELVDKMSYELFGRELDRINNDISSGKYMTLEEKQNSLIRGLPEKAVRAIASRKDLLGELEGTVYGMSRGEIREREARRVEDFNTSLKASIASARKSYKPGKTYTAKDLRDYAKTLDGIDIGFLDDKKVQAAADDMLKAGMHPTAIITAILGTINENTNLFGKSFVVNGDDGYARMIARAREVDGHIKGGTDGNNKGPNSYIPIVDRTIPQIRLRGLSEYRAGRLGDYYQPEVTETKPSTDLPPTPAAGGTYTTTATPEQIAEAKRIMAEGSYSSYNPFHTGDIPRDDDFVPSKEEVEFMAAKEAHLRANRPGLGDEIGGAVATAATMAGRLPGIVGYGIGSVSDVYDDIVYGENDKDRERYARALSFFQPDENSSKVHRRNVKALDSVLATLPANMPIVRGRQGPYLGPKHTLKQDQLLAANTAKAALDKLGIKPPTLPTMPGMGKGTPKAPTLDAIIAEKLAAQNPRGVSDIRLSEVPAMYRADMARLLEWHASRSAMNPPR